MEQVARSSLHFMLTELYAESKQKITGYMNEGVQICGHLFGKSLIFYFHSIYF